PGLTQSVSERLEKYVIADDVQIVDVGPHYGLLSVQGPKAAEVLVKAGFSSQSPAQPFSFSALADTSPGEIYLVNNPRLATGGFDLFVPSAKLGELADKLLARLASSGGLPCGWDAFELARVEAGITRFGADMDETTIPL